MANADWVVGVHAVTDVLQAAPQRVRRVLIADGRNVERLGEILRAAEQAEIRVERVPKARLDRLEGDAAHQGVAAQCEALGYASEADLGARLTELDNALLLVLDGVQDPRNFGACLRSAEAAGVDAVIVPRHGAAPLSTVVAKTASGALNHLLIVGVANLARCLSGLKERGIWVVGADDAAAERYYEVDLSAPTALVLGSEGKGLRRLTRATCDRLTSIPMAGQVTSLNVSVATGVLLFEATRQRAAAKR